MKMSFEEGNEEKIGSEVCSLFFFYYIILFFSYGAGVFEMKKI